MKKFKQSLVVGKFCPLHFGHIHVIREALRQSEHVIIFSYTSEKFENCQAVNRQYWLSTVFEQELNDGRLEAFIWEDGAAELPDNDDPAYDHRLFCAQNLEEQKLDIDAIFGSEDYIEGFAQVVGMYFGKEITPVVVDKARELFKISGTELRKNPEKIKMYTPECIQRSFIPTVLILGGESSGKTTLAKNLACFLDTEWVPEYGREYYDSVEGKLVFEDMEKITIEQLTREYFAEKKILDSGKIKPYICDTSPLTTLFYSLHLFGKVSERLAGFAYNRVYSHVFLCAPDFPFVQDGTRQDDSFRRFGHRFYVNYLNGEGIPYTLLHGDLYDRMGQALKVLKDKKIVL